MFRVFDCVLHVSEFLVRASLAFSLAPTVQVLSKDEFGDRNRLLRVLQSTVLRIC